MIKATQGQGYGKYEFDLQNGNGIYVGLMIGTETEAGIVWEIQRWRDGNPDGSILRLPVTPKAEALRQASEFVK